VLDSKNQRGAHDRNFDNGRARVIEKPQKTQPRDHDPKDGKERRAFARRTLWEKKRDQGIRPRPEQVRHVRPNRADRPPSRVRNQTPS